MRKIELDLPIYTFHIDFAGHVGNIVYIQWMELGRLKFHVLEKQFNFSPRVSQELLSTAKEMLVGGTPSSAVRPGQVRLVALHRQGMLVEEIAFLTQSSMRLVKEYLGVYEAAMAESHRREKLEEELARVSARQKAPSEEGKKGEVKR